MLIRIDATTLTLPNSHDVPVRVFANEEVRIEKSAVDELESFLELSHTLRLIKDADPDFFGGIEPSILQVAVTPDFHKGAGIPIGTVMLTRGFVSPQAIGNDVNCGMRLYTTDLTEDKIRAKLPVLEKEIRHSYFEGGRQIPMNRVQREALFREGLQGILNTHSEAKGKGLWKHYDSIQQEKDIHHVNGMGGMKTDRVFALQDFLGTKELSYDAQIGSIGGGNHFVEVQKVADILDGVTAHAWGLKKGMVVAMVHSGSVSIGHLTGGTFKDIVREIFPKALPYPENNIFILPESEQHRKSWDNFWISLSNAANFAFANRLFLGLMMYKILSEYIGSCAFKLLYDTGHNLVWEEMDGKHCFLHRKGACPARGAEQMAGTVFEYYGEPVLIPGSMGASSFILAGMGSQDSLFSASHGAGRSLSRGDALKCDDALFKKFMERFKIITPIDPNRQDLKGRQDILKKWEDDLKKEAPFAYKDIGPIIQTQVDSRIARVVAELEPIFTVKG